ncbi:MAG: hypothetical protein LBD23_11075, partial [Oscillospiraceae bacterium]|nr:hypothetical protein [Oscillospiraceae bacterium]
MKKAYILHYDLDDDMRPCKGELSFDSDGHVSRTAEKNHNEKEKITEQIDITDAEEATVLAGVGCGLVYIKYKDERETVLCRFSLSALKPAGEFCKIINFFIQTGEKKITEVKEKYTCEKCGRSLAEELSVCLFCYNR